MKKTNRSNKRIILFMLMLSLVVSTGTFAYWASSVEGTSEEATGTLSIGYADGVETRFELTNNLEDGGLLVPNGQTVNSEDVSVEEINVSYNLVWKEDTDQSQLIGTTTTGKVSVSHSFLIELDGVELESKEYSQIYDLIHITYDETNPTELTLDGEMGIFAFSITMDEPSNQEEYNMISTAKITVIINYRMYDNFIETMDSITGAYMVLKGDSIVYLEVGNKFVDEGAQAFNSIGEEIKRTWYNGEINTWKVGTYTLQYSAYSSYDNETVNSVERTIVVVDTTAPVITTNGNDTIIVTKGTSYSDWGAWALDNSNDEVTVNVTGIDSVDTNTAGTYYVTYMSIDNSGNEATSIRTIVVK